MSVSQELKAVPVSGIWKAILSSAKEEQAVLLHTCPKSDYFVAVKIPDRHDKAFTIVTIAAFARIFKKTEKSFMVDNSKEFAAHKELAAGTGMKVFFCDQYSPWQRDTNENTNSLFRQFFSKGISFDDLSDEQLQAVVDLVNKHPRKHPGLRSSAELPLEFFVNFVALN